MNLEYIKAKTFCKHITDGTHDSPKYVNFGYHLVTSRFIKNNKVNLELSPYISEFDYNKINLRSKIEINDILFSMIGTVGEVALVKSDDFAIKNMGLFRCKNEIDAKYLYYYLQSNLAKNFITATITGSTQHYLTLESLKNFEIPVFQNSVKQHIVDIIKNGVRSVI